VTPAAQKDAATPSDLPKKEVPWSAGAERPAALKPAALKPAATAPDQLAERQYRLRVKALLSEAHTSAIRGELHAAYRSALLAEQVAEEHHIAMRDGDENPRDVARDIAAKIWRASNVAEETAPTDLAAPTATEQPAAATEGFPGANAFATWTPLGQLRAVAPAAPAASELPAIRPGAAPGADDWMAHAAPLPAPVAEAAQPTLAKTSKAPRWSAGDAAMQLPAADQSGVKFAIAQTISPDEVLAQGIAPPELQPAPIPPEFEISRLPQLSAATLDVHRPALLAPPALSPAGAPATWSELSQPSAAAISAAPAVRPGGWSWKLLWSGLGLAAAGISIAFGIRVSRKPTVLVPAPALPVAEALPADEVASGRSIQFKRAA
jgi:hypothetical protein